MRKVKSLPLQIRGSSTPQVSVNTDYLMMEMDFSWLSPKKFIGKGTEGRVFGPLSLKDFPTDFPIETLDPEKTYVIKIFHRPKKISTLGSLDVKYKVINQYVRRSERHFFILPVIIGLSRNKKFITGEVQEYGGIELFDWINDEKKKEIPLHLFPTLKKICKTCIEILNKHNILITDIKIENMVMRNDGSVSLIDFDVLTIDGEPTSFMTTFSPIITPIQFINIMSKYHTGASYMRNHLMQKYENQYKRLHKIFFSPPTRTVKPTHTAKPTRTVLGTHAIPSDIDIARFSLLWVFINMIQIILRFKGNKKSLERFYHTFNVPMLHNRTQSVNHLMSAFFDKPPV